MIDRLLYRRQIQGGAPHLLFVLCLLGCFLVLGAAMSRAANLRRIVEFQPGTPVPTQQAIVAESGSTLLTLLSLINAAVIELPADAVQEALASLLSHPEVKRVYEDAPISTQGPTSSGGIEGGLIMPTDPPADGYTWNLLQIALHQVNPAVRGAGVHVAVVDTGIDPSHPELAGKVVGGVDAQIGGTSNTGSSAAAEEPDAEGPDAEGSDSFIDCNGHGTHVAGIIAGNTVGIAPDVQLYAVRVLDCQGAGFVSYLLNGLEWIYLHNTNSPLNNLPKIDVVNMSLGFYRTDTALYPMLHQYIKALHDIGTVLVASAGNYKFECVDRVGGGGLVADVEGPDVEGPDVEGPDADNGGTSSPPECNTRVKFPARYAATIAVAASTIERTIADYSIRGPAVRLTAPGGKYPFQVRSTTVSESSETDDNSAAAGEGPDVEGPDVEGPDGVGAYGLGSGTSMAAAHVTGVVGLMLSANPMLTPDAVLAILQETADALEVTMSAQGSGIISAAQAVSEAQGWGGDDDDDDDDDDEVEIGEQTVIGTESWIMAGT
ncbi:MAG: S8 family serine peptidase, partial [Candidatus Tectomicrobia bacterium]